jgi:hypothetical protein
MNLNVSVLHRRSLIVPFQLVRVRNVASNFRFGATLSRNRRPAYLVQSTWICRSVQSIQQTGAFSPIVCYPSEQGNHTTPLSSEYQD